DLTPLENLTSLQSIDCSHSQVSVLSTLVNLAFLQSIDCSHSQVSDLSALVNLASLQSIDCSSTQVSDLTPLENLTSLQSIDCSHSQVSDLSALEKLTSLQSINCSHSQVSDLSALEGLASLQSIDCSHSQVSDLGPLINIPSLKSIYSHSIPIRSIPAKLVNKSELVGLYISDIPMTGIPPEILSGNSRGSCLESLRSHYTDLSVGSVALPDIKFMVLGNGRIGKTQICRRLRGEDFEEDADSTHGITVTSARFQRGSATANPPLLHIWDFGGQDIYHGTHALFMRSKAVFLTVWTPSSEERSEHEHRGMVFRNHRLDYWLEMVRQLGGKNSPVLVIQTQCDTVAEELRQPPVPDLMLDPFGFCKILHYSAKLDRGRAALDEAIDEAIRWANQQQGDLKIGAGRLRVRRRLETLREEDTLRPPGERKYRVIKKEFFVQICAEEGGVSNPDHLIDYLHECGVVFHRSHVFENAIILDQEWALEAIYTLFNREKCWRQLRQLKGRFTQSLLASLVWQEYEEDEQALFIHMMKSAGICFVHREADAGAGIEAEYIAPDLLPELATVQEELVAYWQNEVSEEKILDFPFEYPGLVRSVIARIGANAGMNALYWKEGVCGFDRRTQSAIRIDTLPPKDGKPYQLRLRIRTQRGSAKELLEQSLEWISQLARQSGCENIDKLVEPAARQKKERVAKEIQYYEDREKPGNKELDFGPPPSSVAKTYCVSYAWTKESSEIVDQLCANAAAQNIEVIRDKTHLDLGERISKFMNRLSEGDRIFIILSEKYLSSPFCMYELFEVWRQSKRDDESFLKRIRIYRLPDAKIGTLIERLEIGVFWKKQYEQVEALIREHGPEIIGGTDFNRYKLMKDFALHVGDLIGLAMDTLQPQTIEELESFGFDLPEKD
ncbi:MAG: COR domain-containing protein, partial [Verrucomicrobiota bacterium]